MLYLKERGGHVLGGIDFTFGKNLIRGKLEDLNINGGKVKEGSRLVDIPTFVVWFDPTVIKGLSGILDSAIKSDIELGRTVYVRQVIFALKALLLTQGDPKKMYSIHLPKNLERFLETAGLIHLLNG